MPRMIDLVKGDSGNDAMDPRKDDGAQDKDVQDKNYLLMSKKIISATKGRGQEDTNKASSLYDHTIDSIKELLEKIRKNEDINPHMAGLHSIIDDHFNQIILNEAILDELYKKRDGYYLPYHISNVLILSIFLGIKMGLNKSKIRDLGVAAIFYDTGLDRCSAVISKPSKLSEDEIAIVKTHIGYSLEILNKVSRITQDVKDAVRSHHERIDGGGYPEGLKTDAINRYAKIIGLVDTYEAMTNKRSYREGENAHETIKHLLNSLKGHFDSEVMRYLINATSLYPIGTMVELDSGEVARVIGVEPGSPLRPIVMIVRDFDGSPVKENKIINLATNDKISIINSL